MLTHGCENTTCNFEFMTSVMCAVSWAVFGVGLFMRMCGTDLHDLGSEESRLRRSSEMCFSCLHDYTPKP